MRVLFFGTPDFAVPSLESLLNGPDELVAVVSRVDRPKGRGLKLESPPVVRRAREAGVPVLQPTRLHSSQTLSELENLNPDLIVTCAFGRILRPALLELPRLGCINVHASLLPRHRGASPIPHTLLAGDAWTGVTIFRLDEGMDTGPILLQRLVRTATTETCGSLTERLACLGGEALTESLDRIRRGTTDYYPQPEDGATYAPLLKKEDGRCDWAQSAERFERFVRAMDPWPGARVVFDGQPLRISAAEPVDLIPRANQPGTVLGVDPDPIVATDPGSIRLTRVQAAGKREMEASAWARGVRLQSGALFA